MTTKTAGKKDSTLGRDSLGRYVGSDLISNLVTKTVSNKDSETLIDLHINNPLHKIIEILQDIKKQKAFSFSIKGSIGILGVGLIAVSSGIMGGNKILCDKGVQTKVGTVWILAVTEHKDNVGIIQGLLNTIRGSNDIEDPVNRVVLIDSSGNPTTIVNPKKELTSFGGIKVLATGRYNSCNMELELLENGVENYPY